MAQGVLPFMYELERSKVGMTTLAGLPLNLDLWNFARFSPHADPKDKARNPALYFTDRSMSFLIIGIFPFFGLHTVLWLYRSLRDQARAREPQGGSGDGPDDYEEERENEGRAS